jgi:hypothetical protein
MCNLANLDKAIRGRADADHRGAFARVGGGPALDYASQAAAQ